MGGVVLASVAYSPLDVSLVSTAEGDCLEFGETETQPGRFLCYNPYQVLNDLNKFDQDKYLGEILKKRRKAKANQINYDVDLLNVQVKDTEIIRPEDSSVTEDPRDRHIEMYDPDSDVREVNSMIRVDRPIKVSTKDLCNYIDHSDLTLIADKYNKQVIVKKLGSSYEPQSHEVCIWSLNRNQLSRGHNTDADDMVYYYLSANAHVDDYFYASYNRL